MKTSSRQRSIAARLTWMNVLVIGIALILAYVSFFAYNLIAYREATINSLTGEAQIIGENSVSAILFDDRATAQATLSALSSSRDVDAAAIYTQQNVPFALYARSSTDIIQLRPIPAKLTLAYWTHWESILIGSRIVFQGKQIGIVYIQAHLYGLHVQIVRYAAIAGAILLVCMGVALLVGSIFRRMLAQPIVSISETARMVTRYRDYSLRFSPGESYSEMQLLTVAFNEMLAEIQQRDKALAQSKDKLELRVSERTAELVAANKELEAFSYTVAHDLRGPLDTISGINYIIQHSEEQSRDDRSRQMLGRLGTSITEMTNLIDDLLNLSRSTSIGLHLVQQNIGLLASTILERLAEAEPERQVEITVHKKLLCQCRCGPHAGRHA